MSTIICPRCGAENGSGGANCIKCDAPIEDSPSQCAAPPAQPRRGSKVWIAVVLLAVIGCAALAGWWFFLRPPSPADVVRQFAGACSTGDFAKMKPFLNRDSITMIQMIPGGEEAVVRVLRSAVSRTGGKPMADVSITGSSIDPNDRNQATVEFMVHTKGGAKSSGLDPKHEIVLLREDGKWKIDAAGTVRREMEKAFRNGFHNGFTLPGSSAR